MKSLSLFLAISVIFSLFSPSIVVNAVELTTDNNRSSDSTYTFNAVDSNDYHKEDANFVIYGNYTNFDSSLLYNVTHDKEKICIFYDVNLLDNVTTQHVIMQNHAVVYYYKEGVPYVHSYISNSTNKGELLNDINNYVNEILSEIDSDQSVTTMTGFLRNSTYTSGNETFVPLYAGSSRKDEKPYGYIDCTFSVKKYRANDVSSLYLVESRVSFTPGMMARDLGNTDYDKWYNSTGFAKIKAMEATNEVGYGQVRHGGTPIFKDAYPVNDPSSVTISSSFNTGINLGTSTSAGFSLGTSDIGADLGGGNSASLTLSYEYSKVYSYQDPALSAQKDPSDAEKYTWLYTYEEAKNETNHLDVGYMFEMNNSGHDLLEGDLAVRFEYQMTVDNKKIWIFNKTYTFSGSAFFNYY